MFKQGNYVIITDDYGRHSGHVARVLSIESGAKFYNGARYVVQCECKKQRGFTAGQLASLNKGITWLQKQAQGDMGNPKYHKNRAAIMHDLRERMKNG